MYGKICRTTYNSNIVGQCYVQPSDGWTSTVLWFDIIHATVPLLGILFFKLSKGSKMHDQNSIVKTVHVQLDFSQISFVCLIAWFAWAGLIRLRGLLDLPGQDWSGWEGVPDLPEQDWSGWEGLPDLPEQDWSGWEGCLICMSRIFGPAQKIRRSGKLPNLLKV